MDTYNILKNISSKAGQRHENILDIHVDMAVIDGAVLKGRHIVIPEALQRQALEQLHVNHMGIGKAKLLACKSIYLTGMNDDIENHIKIVLHNLIFSKHSQRKTESIMKFQENLWK